MARKTLVFVVCVAGLLCMQGIVVAQPAAVPEQLIKPRILGQPIRRGDNRSEKRQKLARVRQISTEIRDIESDRDRDKLAEELEKLVTELFDMEVKESETMIARLQNDVDRKKQDREKLIQERIEQALDPNSVPGLAGNVAPRGKPYKIESTKKKDDGSSIVKVRFSKVVPATREETYTVMIPQTRTRVVNGETQNYTVTVPEQRTRMVSYMAYAPGDNVETVTIPKGKDRDEAIRDVLRKRQLGGGNSFTIQSVKKAEDGSSVATVTIMLAEQRTREVPYTVMVPQTRTRMVNGKEQSYTVNVPETRTRTERYTVNVPVQTTVKIPKGKDKNEVVAEFAKKKMRGRRQKR